MIKVFFNLKEISNSFINKKINLIPNPKTLVRHIPYDLIF